MAHLEDVATISTELAPEATVKFATILSLSIEGLEDKCAIRIGVGAKRSNSMQSIEITHELSAFGVKVLTTRASQFIMSDGFEILL